MNAGEMVLDRFDARLRRVETRVAQFEDAISVYGAPDPRPLFVVRIPRTPTLTRTQTTIVVYAFAALAIGLYTFAKLRANEELV